MDDEAATSSGSYGTQSKPTAGTHSWVTPKGPQKAQMLFRVAPDGNPIPAPVTFAMKGGWRTRSGEQVLTGIG